MNRVVLRQESKKKEKEKKKFQKPIVLTKEDIRHRLIVHFQNHIGESNKTTDEEIFQAVVGINSLAVDSFSRFYWWEQIQSIIRELRRKDICFTIKKNGNYFVLQEQEEADYYKGLCDKAINHMENAKERADDWVSEEKWKKFEASKGELDNEKVGLEPAKKPTLPKTTEEKVDDNINKAEKRIVKLWKGEKADETRN